MARVVAAHHHVEEAARCLTSPNHLWGLSTTIHCSPLRRATTSPGRRQRSPRSGSPIPVGPGTERSGVKPATHDDAGASDGGTGNTYCCVAAAPATRIWFG